MDMNIHIRLLGEALEVGDSTNPSLCPSCEGGSTKETSFSVTRDPSGLLYNCYRASCFAKGFVPTAAGLLSPVRTKQKLRIYTGAIRPLEKKDVDYFYIRFGLTSMVSHVLRSDRGEYILPIYNGDEFIRGYVVRQPTWKGKLVAPRLGDTRPTTPKARTFPQVDEPMQSFYLQGTGALVVVEDQISAMVVAQAGFNSVALLGTTVNMAKVREWSLLQPKEVIIALDKDATGEAFRIARKWGLAFPKLRVAMLERDLKDEQVEDISGVLGVNA